MTVCFDPIWLFVAALLFGAFTAGFVIGRSE